MVLEVVVGLGPLARAELVAVFPVGEMVLDRPAAGVAGVIDLVLRAVDIAALLVGQHERVLALLVLEEVEDAFLFHQPRDEVEVGLAVLHAVVALRVLAARAGA